MNLKAFGKTLVSFVLILTMLMSSALAYEELAKGSKGDAVVALQEKLNERMEKGNQQEMKGIARAMTVDDKNIVLKTISTEVLLGEVSRRMQILENRDKAIKELFRIPEE
jgi:hypothetical protein